MDIKKASSSQAAFKWALINLIATIVITYAFQFLNVDQTTSVKYLTYLPFIIFLLLTQQEYKTQLGGYLNYGEGFLSGFLYSVFTGIMVGIFIYLYFAILSPEMVGKIMEQTRQQLESQGKISEDQIDSTITMLSKFFAVITAAAIVFMYALFGAIVSLISSAIIKNERSPFDIPNDFERGNTSDPSI